MLLFWIFIYLVVSLAAGVNASRRVHSSRDFILAGRKLPFFMATSTVFATWFGSETILGASSEFAEHGLPGVIEEPFGAALCLILVGVFFARPLYRRGYLTFGDFYRDQFGSKTETVAAIALILSYFGWIAAQFVAMGIILNLVTGVSVEGAMIFTALIVIFYTYLGGMWAVSFTDSVQMLMIVGGLLVSAWYIMPAGGITDVIASAPPGFFRFFPEGGAESWIIWTGALMTLGLGSIPQQDVYQRVMSSRSEKIAVWSSITAGVLYLSVAFIPLFLGLVARRDTANAGQNLLPELIMGKTPLAVQVVFIGALISAIMSTASGGILAPSSILSENIIRPLLHKKISDSKFLVITRDSVIAIAVVALFMALYQRNIYELVAQASALSLVSLFVPLIAGLFFDSRSENAALVSIVAGLVVWLAALWKETVYPDIFYGLGASFLGYVLVVLFERVRKKAG